MIEQLSEKIWSMSQFQEDFNTVRKLLLSKRYTNKVDCGIGLDSLQKLLSSAAILASSSNEDFRSASYIIALSALELNGEEYPTLSSILYVVLTRIGNFPAANFAKNSLQINKSQLPLKIYDEINNRELNNTVELHGGSVSLTDFQYILWNKLISERTIGVSAPTSAGKSFIFQAYAKKVISENNNANVCFLVPTRALINQVSDDVSKWINSPSISAELISTPITKDNDLPVSGVYVVTQERLQMLHTAHPELIFDVLFIDEFQNIADGSRGVLLASVIEESILRSLSAKIFFAGPNIIDPGNIAHIFDRKAVSVKTKEAAVIQNLIHLDCVIEKPNVANLSIRSGDKKITIGEIESDQPLISHENKLINLALILGDEGQSLIYALGPSECELIAFGLADTDKLSPTPEQIELSEFIKEAIHPSYQLASTVLSGVGFHYGRLPSLVRKTIEDSFSAGVLKFLVSTSTLLYGVNLPARNLFLHMPQKGKGKPINSIDFWNLAGRAGRLGKEFMGNVFLIDYDSWDTDPIQGPQEQEVKPVILEHVFNRTNELISYIEDENYKPDRNQSDEFEATFVKLTSDFMKGRIDSTLDRLGLDQNAAYRHELIESLKNAISGKNISLKTISASPSVSIYRQQALYKRLNASLNKKGPEYIVPRHPLHSTSYTSYLAVIKRCHSEILQYPKKDQSHKYYAMIALKWMKGHPLPQIIEQSYKYRLSKNEKTNIAIVIREMLNEIERDLRFKYVRLFTCYNAVLEQVLKDNGHDDLIASIPSVPTYLEVGACSPTMVSFMGVGLSRYTAGKLQKLPRKTDMDQASARDWLKRQNIEALDLPTASIKEIKRLIIS
tara:strand:- start:437 stop:2968 length:2532 start_codon:yes stop_codon:yes gene_type:complete